jgi:hypothetical protein
MTIHRARRIAAAGLLAVASTLVVGPSLPATAGQIAPDDVKLTTNEAPVDNQLAYDPVNDRYLAVWTDGASTPERIRGVVITSTGVPGAPFTIHEANDAIEPAVAANTVTGGWMVAYVTEESAGAREIAVSQVTSSGTTGFAGSSTFISSMGPPGDPSYDARRPAIAFDPGAPGFAVVWDGDDDSTGNGQADLWARRVTTGGSPIGAAEVNLTGPTPLLDEENPSIAFTAGRYVIVYEELDLATSRYQIHNITVDGLLGDATPPIDMTSVLASLTDVIDPRVAAGNGGGVFVFEGEDATGLLSAWAGVVDPGSGMHTVPTQISGPPTPGFEADDVQVAFHPVTGNYSVVWEGERSGVTAANEEEIFATIVSPTLTIVEPIERISTMGVDGVTTSYAYSPAVAPGEGAGHLVVFGGDNPDPAAGADQTAAGDSELFGQLIGPTADLAVSGVTTPISPTPPLAGSAVQYSVAITNAGPAPATGIGLTAVVPTGLVIGGITAGNTYTHPSTVDLLSGGSTSVTVDAQIAAGATKGQTIAPTFTVVAPTGVADPTANNSGTAATITVDGPPVVTAFTLASDNIDPSVAGFGDEITASITTDEAITAPTVTIAGRTATVNGSGTSWNATITVDGTTPEGAVIARITAAQDLAGIAMAVPVSSTNDVTVDRTPPAPVIDSAEPDPTNASPFDVTVDFGEAVTGFVAGDLDVTNGTAGTVAGGVDGEYTVAITPTADGVVVIDLPAGAASDAVGNASLGATTYEITFDTSGPTPVISSTESDPSNAAAFVVTIDFGEPVTGFALGDVVAGNASLSALTDAGGGAFGVTVTPTADGTVTIDVAAGVATDAAGNDNVAAAQFSIDSDTTAPTVTIEQGATQTDSTNISPIVFDVVFSEAVTGFGGADVVVSGTAGATTATVTPVSTSAYTVQVTGMTGDGTVVATVAAGAATDAAGNANAASTSTDNTVTYIAGDVTPGANDAPTITAPTTIAAELAEPVAFTGPATVAVADPDALDGELVVTLSIDVGQLALGSSTGLTVTGGPTSWTLTGTLAELNAALATLTATVSDIGTSTIEITVDDQGNTGGAALTDAASVAVTVVDTTAPTIVVPSTTVTVQNDPGRAGAVVTYEVTVRDPGSAAPTERFVDLEPAPSLACTPSSGSFFPIGSTTVMCTATDSSGNSSTASFTVQVVDTEDPVIAAGRNQSAVLPTGTAGPVAYVAPTATDNSGSVTVSCAPPSGSTMSAGVVTITCTATDPSGNTASTSFTVTVTAARLPDTGGGGLTVLPWALLFVGFGGTLLAGSVRRRRI